jgi:hypothetical protein
VTGRRAVTAPVGFVLLSHREPGQVVRLVDRLRRLYGAGVPIALHHDEGQSALAAIPGVRRVAPSLPTRWGRWSQVEASLAALRLLHAGGGPELAVLLSGTDYPVAPAARVLDDLGRAGADVFMCARPVERWRRDRVAPGPLGFKVNEGAHNQEVCFRRYVATTWRWRGLHQRIRSPLLAPLLAPFSRRFRAYAGATWWTLRRPAVEALLEFTERRRDIVGWYVPRDAPDEGYPQTVLANAPGLRVEWRDFRYVDWSTAEAHPRTLGLADLPRVLRSGAHFARKFAPDDPALDALDRALGLPAWDGRA